MWLIAALVLALSVAYYYIQRRYTWWEHENVPTEKVSIPFGSLDPVRRGERAPGLIFSDIYQRFNDKIVGIYMFFQPTLLVRDAELAKSILVTDFPSFHDRGIYLDEEHDPLAASLFNMRGQQWRTLRNKLTPSFSSGKLKAMFETIDNVGDKLVNHLNGLLKDEPNGSTIEMKDLTTTYAIDIIGSVIFGLDVDSFTNPKNEFRNVSKQIFENNSSLPKLHGLASFICPPIAKWMNRLGYKDKPLYDLKDLVQHTVEFRENNKIVRKDILQLLIKLRNSGKIGDDDDSNWDIETAAEDLKSMSIELITAQAFLFYIAGSETTSATAALTLYELSMYPDIMKRAQTEIVEVLAKHNLKPSDKLTYEAIQDMKFIDLCVMETVRKYPGLPFLNRECTQDFEVPEMNYTIKKGTPIIISLFGLHHDPEYFPNPNTYDPDRFDPEIMNYNPVAYMPFGEGPRHCIALRMGKVGSKVAIVKVLANFNIEPQPLKEVEFAADPSPVLIAKNGLKMHLKNKQQSTQL